jgi:hypothetical protein
MNDDDLDPEVLAALRDVAPASDALRDKHIAAALAEISAASSRSRTKWLSAAAAVIVLLVGGNALYASLSPSTDSNVTPRNGVVTTTVPVKGSVCGANLADYTFVGTYSSAGAMREVWSSKQDLVVADQTSCAPLGTFTHPDVIANEKTCDGFFSTTDTQWVGAYSVAGTTLTLIANTNELQIRDGSCAVIASYPLPTGP